MIVCSIDKHNGLLVWVCPSSVSPLFVVSLTSIRTTILGCIFEVRQHASASNFIISWKDCLRLTAATLFQSVAVYGYLQYGYSGRYSR